MTSLDGKVAVITGATSGIGARTAEIFVEAGARVVIAGRRRDKGEALAAKLGNSASFIRTDVSIETDVAEMIEHAVHRFGRIDCLFNNAGSVPPSSDIASVKMEDFDAAIALHVRAALAGMKHVAPIMIRQRSGSIINMSSIVGIRAGIGALTYSTAKAAVLHLTRCAAVELGEHGIRVNSVSPGRVVTGIFGKAMGLENDAADLHADAVRQALKEILPHEQPLPRIGTDNDVAQTVLFLASDGSSFVNGHDLVVDGGAMAGLPASVMRAQLSYFAKAFEHLGDAI